MLPPPPRSTLFPYTTLFRSLGSHAAVARPVSARATAAGIVAAKADPDAAIRLAWGHILDNIGVALLMATAIALLASLARSEEHTSELQSQFHLVCRLLLEKK